MIRENHNYVIYGPIVAELVFCFSFSLFLKNVNFHVLILSICNFVVYVIPPPPTRCRKIKNCHIIDPSCIRLATIKHNLYLNIVKPNDKIMNCAFSNTKGKKTERERQSYVIRYVKHYNVLGFEQR